MPRPLVFSNGRLLVGLDECLNIRELFFPNVGLYDHLCGQMVRMGVWANGAFSWIDDDEWARTLTYEQSTLVSRCTLTSIRLGLQMTIQDCVLPNENAFLRSISVKNLGHLLLDVRIFFNHDLKIAESDTGLTAFFHPYSDSLIHYKGPFAFLFGGRAGASGLYAYNTGVRRQNGEHGTMGDAEDGALDMNPICQGTVDSTVSLKMELAAAEEEEASYFIVAGSSVDDVVRTFRSLRSTSPKTHRQTAARHDHGALALQSGRFEGLPEDLKAFCNQSYLLLKTQIDVDGGILAANDSDIMVSNRAHYSYVWPRDGSLVAGVLDRVGDHNTSNRYLRFCQRILPSDTGLFLQKYQPDGTFGASWLPWLTESGPEVPIQEDETALTLIALRDHLVATDAVKSGRTNWIKTVNAMSEGLLRHRDEGTSLPLPSHDLWEERRGLHAFTAASVIVALEAAGELKRAWGAKGSDECLQAAASMREAFLHHFFDKERKTFSRMLHPDLSADVTPDAATLLVGLVGAIPMEDPRVVATARYVKKWLTVRSDVGGIARYTGDWYWRQSEQYPGNPWIICTMWLAQTQIALSQNREELREPLEWIRWAKRYAAPTGVLPEQLHPDTGRHLSVSPLTWSHSELLRTALDWCERRAELV